MKTDDLISLLGTHTEPVKSNHLRNTILAAVAAGAAASLCLMLLTLGAPETFSGGEGLGLKIVGLGLTLSLVAAGVWFLLKAARPGKISRKPVIAIGLVSFVALVAAIGLLFSSHPATWGAMLFGPQWAACLLCIPFFALLPFTSIIWALRKEAPTSPTWAGAIAGLVAGALGATAYTLHQASMSIPFMIFWYLGPILICVAIGAMLGSRLLRW
ncbi:MAG: DUF1109 domain-containing protein [Rhodospirillaceae bacterium]|nr:MAG: DUF1109 domain-containing protein [Rhodospirillaceae bacterium]